MTNDQILDTLVAALRADTFADLPAHTIPDDTPHVRDLLATAIRNRWTPPKIRDAIAAGHHNYAAAGPGVIVAQLEQIATTHPATHDRDLGPWCDGCGYTKPTHHQAIRRGTYDPHPFTPTATRETS